MFERGHRVYRKHAEALAVHIVGIGLRRNHLQRLRRPRHARVHKLIFLHCVRNIQKGHKGYRQPEHDDRLAIAQLVRNEVLPNQGSDCVSLPHAEEDVYEEHLQRLRDVERKDDEAEQHAKEQRDEDVEEEANVSRKERERKEVVDGKAEHDHHAGTQQRGPRGAVVRRPIDRHNDRRWCRVRSKVEARANVELQRTSDRQHRRTRGHQEAERHAAHE
mmetsp:Transcript_15036/g.47026  ORF Transcript_15036/g.47026 Transcript_15036/m.47026 type:complete len:218 (+) Transcript_15036:690-1343(+)